MEKTGESPKKGFDQGTAAGKGNERSSNHPEPGRGFAGNTKPKNTSGPVEGTARGAGYIEEPQGLPSQAEGDRETKNGSQSGGMPNPASGKGGKANPEGRPSQAEGDRETIESDLSSKNL